MRYHSQFGITILFLFMSSFCFAQGQGPGIEMVPLKTVEGRVILRNGVYILIGLDGKGWLLKKNPELEEQFNKAKELADKDCDVIINGRETGETKRFEYIKYEEGNKTTVRKEEYTVLEVFLIGKVTTPSKITQADIEKVINSTGAEETVPATDTENSKTSEENTTTSTLKNAKKSSLAKSLKQQALATPKAPITPPILAEAEGKVIFLDLNHSPMPIIKLDIASSAKKSEVVTISVPKGIGVLKNSEGVKLEEVKKGDKVSIWYKEYNEEKIADMISVLK